MTYLCIEWREDIYSLFASSQVPPGTLALQIQFHTYILGFLISIIYSHIFRFYIHVYTGSYILVYTGSYILVYTGSYILVYTGSYILASSRENQGPI